MTEYEFVQSKLRDYGWELKKYFRGFLITARLPSGTIFTSVQKNGDNLIVNLIDSFLNFSENEYILERIDTERKYGMTPNVSTISYDAEHIKRCMTEIVKSFNVVEHKITISDFNENNNPLGKNRFYWKITKKTMGETYICARGSSDSISEAAKAAESEYKKLVK